MRTRLSPLAGAMLLAACSAPAGDYPSLLPRPIEKTSFAEPDRPAPEAVADPAMEIRVAEEARMLAAAGAAFDGGATAAERLARAARGAAAGSEAWIAAQVALSDLDGLRGGTSNALADIERLAIDRAAEGKPAYPALEALRAKAEAQNRAEIARLAAMERGLAPA